MQISARFSLRNLLIAVGLVALLVAILEMRPSPQIKVAFQSEEVATIDKEVFDRTTLSAAIARESLWRKCWFQYPEVVILLPESVLNDEFFQIETLAEKNKPSNPPMALRRHSVSLQKLTKLLEKHKLSGFEEIVIGGVNANSQSPSTFESVDSKPLEVAEKSGR